MLFHGESRLRKRSAVSVSRLESAIDWTCDYGCDGIGRMLVASVKVQGDATDFTDAKGREIDQL